MDVTLPYREGDRNWHENKESGWKLTRGEAEGDRSNTASTRSITAPDTDRGWSVNAWKGGVDVIMGST